jgi:hypothetical protein
MQNPQPLRSIQFIYGKALPFCAILCLIGIASFETRPYVFSSFLSDLIARSLLCLWFCGIYRTISRWFAEDSIDTTTTWPKKVDLADKIYLTFFSGFLGAGFGFFTWLGIQMFLPVFKSIALIVAPINAFVIFLPVFRKYWGYKL